ncbi:MAG: N-acetylmuramoyl-L-alanine amidase [Rhodospirillales bacterium]
MQALGVGAPCSPAPQRAAAPRSRRGGRPRLGIAVAAALAAVALAAGRGAAAAPPREPAPRAPAPSPAAVTQASTTVDANRTTLELTLSDKVGYKVFGLDGPPRVVIDLTDAHWRIGEAAAPKSAGIITGFRPGRPQPGVARLVLDTAGRARIDDTSLKRRPGGGYTLAVVLAGKSPPGSPAPASPTPVSPLAGDGRLPASVAIGATPTKMTPMPRPRDVEVGATGSPGRGIGTGRAETRKPWTIAIDAGHGGVDPGAISPSGLREKTVTLATAREIRASLRAIGGYRVVLTRDSDVFIPLRTRVATARRAGADVFLSVHADKMDDEATRGLSVYTLSERASDAEAAALAERENKVDLIAHMDLRGAAPDVTGILIDLAQRDTKNSSARMAGLVLSSVRADTQLLQRPHRFAGFAVLKAPDMPSVLVELGFLSNPGDEAVLRSPAGRRHLARAIARGIDGYFNSVEVAKQGG